MGNSPPKIRIKNLSYKYSGSNDWVLKNINLEISKGSFFALIGPSGSGKSTLLLLLRGFHQEIGGELKGEIQLFDQDIGKTPIAELGKTVGIVFQNPSLQLHQLRVIDEVASAPMYQGFPYEECQKRAFDLVNRILGKEFYERSPSELSAGQQQKVALAASLSLNAEILLLDEPFSFLDETADKELIKMLVELHKKGKTIIISTHDVAQVAEISSQMGVMNRGELVLCGSPREVLYSSRLSAIMPPPLFVEVAKNTKIPGSPISWSELVSKVGIKKIKNKRASNEKKKIKISLENLSFYYQESQNGVREITLDVYEGEILGIIGANGSGKTTLLKLLMGLFIPQKGKVYLEGKDITRIPTEERAKTIGYVTQDPLDMFFEINLWDEVAAGPKFLNLSEPKKLAEQALKQFNLWQYRDKHPDSISGGEKSKLGMADIVVNNTSVLLLDEPEFGLDPKSWEETTDLLRELKKLGKTIIVITQDLEAAFFLCDKVALMKDGELLKVAPTVEIFKNQALFFEAGLPTLPFFPLLKEFPNKVELGKNNFINNLCQKK